MYFSFLAYYSAKILFCKNIPVSTGRGALFLKSIELKVKVEFKGLEGFAGSIDSLISENLIEVRLDTF